MILPLAYYGNPILRKRAIPVEEITDDLRQLVRDMIETMESKDGLGLAAPQVERSLRLFLVSIPKEDEHGNMKRGEPKIFINPVFSSPSEEEVEIIEGCLSIPGIYESAWRPESIFVEAMNLKGETFKRKLSGMEARVAMHENDHLNGALFVDRIKGKKRNRLTDLLTALKKKFSS